jgi:DnaJ-class molecular chaperone
MQIKEHGKFDLTDIIPFKDICESCGGSGELYKFFRNAATEPCRFCDDGYVLITCRSCKGTTRYKKTQNSLNINVECNRCERDADGKPTGKEKVKCRKCKGSGNFRKLVIAPKIESTTHCRECKGRGFTLPDPKGKPKTAMAEAMEAAESKVENIPKNLGDSLKSADVKE